MNRKDLLKYVFISVTIAVAFFFAGFSWIRYQAEGKGPWVVVFLSDRVGEPTLLITQERLGISKRVVFSGERIGQPNMVRARRIEAMTSALPFGGMISLEYDSPPGIVVLDVFGHEVKISVEALWIDQKKRLWDDKGDIFVERPKR